MSLGGIEECGVDDAVGHGPYAYVGGGVDTDYPDVVAAPEAVGDLRGADGHAVVVGVYQVDVVAGAQQRVDGRQSVVLVPVAYHGGDHVAAAGGKLVDKAAVAPLGGCGAGQAVYLHGIGTGAEQVQGVVRRRAPQPGVVDTDAGRIAVTYYITVKDNHRHTALVHLTDNGSERRGLVGRDDDDVKAVVGKVAYVGNLLLVAVVGRADLDDGILVKHGLAVDLVVHLGAPVVLAALRHTDSIYTLAFVATRHDEQYDEYGNTR